jgi:hypothetical protein
LTSHGLTVAAVRTAIQRNGRESKGQD